MPSPATYPTACGRPLDAITGYHQLHIDMYALGDGLKDLADGKSPAPAGERLTAIDILAIDGDIATVRAEMQHWIDHLQLCLWNGRWLVVNALWRLKAPPPSP